MGKSLRASVLVLVLAFSAQAGHIHNDVAGTPPPPPTITQEAPTAAGQTPSGEAGSLMETVLGVLESLRALF